MTPPTASTKAPIDIFFNVGSDLASSGNGKIEVSFSTTNQYSTASTGFSLSSSVTYICKIKNIVDSSDVPCSLAYSSSYPQFTLTIYSQINAVKNIYKSKFYLFYYTNLN